MFQKLLFLESSHLSLYDFWTFQAISCLHFEGYTTLVLDPSIMGQFLFPLYYTAILGVTIVTPIRNDHGRFRSPHANILGRLFPNCLPT